MQIIPSILTGSSAEAYTLISKCEDVVDRIHIDIIDGQFANNKTVYPEMFEELQTHLMIDYHLMTKEPINWLEKCLLGQADRVIAQVERMSDQLAFVTKATELGMQVGLAIDLDTPVSAIDETILTDLDVVLVMSVKAGFGGQQFNPSVLEKVKQLAEIAKSDPTPFKICVDGGETLDTIDDTIEAGADEVSIGRRLFDGDLKTNVDKFLDAI